MENYVEELKKLGYDITSIIENSKHPRVISQFYRFKSNQDIVLPEWTEQSIYEFSKRIYNIVTRENR